MTDLQTQAAPSYAPPMSYPRQFMLAVGLASAVVVVMVLLFSQAGEPEAEPAEPVAAAPAVPTLAEDCARMERIVSKPTFTGNPFFLVGIAENPALASILEAPAPWAEAPRVWRAVAEARVLCE